MEEVKENPWSEICWYMPESREQYRLSGKLYIIQSDEKDEQLKKVCHVFCCTVSPVVCTCDACLHVSHVGLAQRLFCQSDQACSSCSDDIYACMHADLA